MTDPAAHTPDVDTLVEKLTIALTWAPWDRRREADAALSELAARARLADAQRKPFSTTMREMDRADRLASRVAELEAENADLADFATHRAEHDSRVAELEQERDSALSRTNIAESHASLLRGKLAVLEAALRETLARDDRDRLARRVAELEAALRAVGELFALLATDQDDGSDYLYVPSSDVRRIKAEIDALAGDGGGAPTDPWASYGVTNNPDDVGDGGGA